MKWLPYALGALLLGAAFAIDFDGDGWVTGEEIRYGGNPFDGDSDDDGVSDGWEAKHGLNPKETDSDLDGLPDGAEVSLGANPIKSDTDGDGITDFFENLTDCDNDGYQGLLDTDNDADELPDRHDADPCEPDQDQDSVLDGYEQNDRCIQLPDCDGDGLLDGTETGEFSPLEADSFGVGIRDGVVYAFGEAGQAPSPDRDGDAIPDAWEDGEGLISWGPFDPNPGTPDLLVEYLHVTGPDSGNIPLDFSPAYNAVQSMFAQQGINLQWTETSVVLAEEPFLSFLDPSDQDAFLAIISQGTMSTNPYVTTILMNPQQVQAEFGEILGAAHLRSMIAVLDYGAHATIQLQSSGTASGSFSPSLESHIRTNNQAYLTALGASDYGINGNEYWFEVAGPDGYTATWTPHWFADGITVAFNDGPTETLLPVSVQIDAGGIASTIAHELGHTLGLCHAHQQDCFKNFSPIDQQNHDASTMSYNSPSNQLFFLGSEWNQLRTFLTCPPETPLTLLANKAEPATVLADKYRFTGDVLRTCGEFLSIPHEFSPVSGETVEPFPAPSKSPRGGALWFGLYVLAGAVTIAASVVLGRSTSD